MSNWFKRLYGPSLGSKSSKSTKDDQQGYDDGYGYSNSPYGNETISSQPPVMRTNYNRPQHRMEMNAFYNQNQRFPPSQNYSNDTYAESPYFTQYSQNAHGIGYENENPRYNQTNNYGARNRYEGTTSGYARISNFAENTKQKMLSYKESIMNRLKWPEASDSRPHVWEQDREVSLKERCMGSPCMKTKKRRYYCAGFGIMLFSFSIFFLVRIGQALSLLSSATELKAVDIRELCNNQFEYVAKIELSNPANDIDVAEAVSPVFTKDGKIGNLISEPTVIKAGRNNLTITGTFDIDNSTVGNFQKAVHAYLLGESIEFTIRFNANADFDSSWFIIPFTFNQEVSITRILPSPLGDDSESGDVLGSESGDDDDSILNDIVIGTYDPATAITLLFGLKFTLPTQFEITLELPSISFELFIDDLPTGTGVTQPYIFGVDEVLNALVDFGEDDVSGANNALSKILVEQADLLELEVSITKDLSLLPLNKDCFIYDVIEGGLIKRDIDLSNLQEAGDIPGSESEDDASEAIIELDPDQSFTITDYGNLFSGGNTFVDIDAAINFRGLLNIFNFEGDIPLVTADIAINTTGPSQWQKVGNVLVQPFQLRQAGNPIQTVSVTVDIEDGKTTNFIEFLAAIPGSTKPFVQVIPLPVDLVGRLIQTVVIEICVCVETFFD